MQGHPDTKESRETALQEQHLTKSTVRGTLVRKRKSRKQFTVTTICGNIHQSMLPGYSGMSMHKEE